MDKAQPKKFMYVSRVAEMLCCSEKHVYELIKDGKLDAIRLGKRVVRVIIEGKSIEYSYANIEDLKKLRAEIKA